MPECRVHCTVMHPCLSLMSGNLLVKGGERWCSLGYFIIGHMYIGNFADTAVYEKVCKVLNDSLLIPRNVLQVQQFMKRCAKC